MKKNLNRGYAVTNFNLVAKIKEIAAIQCSDLLSSPVCWQNYLVDILRKTIGKII